MATDQREFTIDDYMKTRVPMTGHRPTLSPDGRYLASTWASNAAFSFIDAYDLSTGANAWTQGAEIWLTDVEAGTSKRLADAGTRTWSPTWSPDGSQLAFLSDASGLVNLWVCDAGDWPSARKLAEDSVYATLPGSDCPAWTADGTRLVVFLRAVGWQPGATLSDDGVTVQVFESERFDGDVIPGFSPLASAVVDVGVVDARSGVVTRTTGPAGATGILPSPCGRWAKVVHSYSRPDMTSWMVTCSVSIVDTEMGTSRVVADGLDLGQALGGGWSADSAGFSMDLDGWKLVRPDGEIVDLPLPTGARPGLWDQHVARLVAVGPADDEQTTEATYTLWSVSLDGSKPVTLDARGSYRNLVKRADVRTFWSPDGATCVVAATSATGASELWQVPLDGTTATLLSTSEAPVSIADVGGRGVVLFAREGEDRPPSYWVTDLGGGDEREVTQGFNPHLGDVAFTTGEELGWRTASGQEAKGRLLLPPGAQLGPLPVVTIAYPMSMDRSNSSWGDMGIIHPQLLTAAGYAVFAPDAQHGTGDFIAGWIVPGINVLIDRGIADPNRLAVMGQSWGGSTVNRIITATSMFKAAVCASGAANEVSMYGQFRVLSDGGANLYGVHLAEMLLGGSPAKVPLDYISRSPVFSAHKVETPLLLIYGSEDSSTGIEQGGEMFTSLRRHGKKVTFLRYMGEGHVPSHYREPNRRDVLARVLAWLAQHLGDA